MQAFAIALAVVCVISLFLRDGRVTLTAVALMLNWLLCSMAVMAIGTNAPWWIFMAIDASTMALLAIASVPNVSHAQMMVLLSYIFEVIAHTAYGVMPARFEYESAYYSTLSWTAWAQLAIVAAWGISNVVPVALYRHLDRARRGRSHVLRRDVGMGAIKDREG